MTTDPNDGITDKQQYDAAVRDLAQFPHGIDPITAWMSGSMWARTHLAAQEPTEAEVEAAALGELAHLQGYDLTDQEDRAEILAWWNGMDESVRNSRLATARAALSAARAARRDEEKR